MDVLIYFLIMLHLQGVDFDIPQDKTCEGLLIDNHSAEPLTLLSLLESVKNENGLIDSLCDDKNVDLNSMFRLDVESDTVVVETCNNSIAIFSPGDSLFLTERDGRFYNDSDNRIRLRERQIKYAAKHGESIVYQISRPESFERELLMNWDIDSLKILCLYDMKDYDVIPVTYLYRFVIRNNRFKVEKDSYERCPAVPVGIMDFGEVQRRARCREALKKNDPEEYRRLFKYRDDTSLSGKIFSLFFRR